MTVPLLRVRRTVPFEGAAMQVRVAAAAPQVIERDHELDRFTPGS